jgi:hypothetical protein
MTAKAAKAVVWPAEDHVCAACGVAYAMVSPSEAAAVVARQPQLIREAVSALTESDIRRRPEPDTWSVLEYACHVRDVFGASIIRLYRTRTEDHPTVDPMLNDLRVARLSYNKRDMAAVLDELDDAAEGLADEIARVRQDGWGRQCSRLPGEDRTAAWLVRQAMHEAVHHLRDIRDVGRKVKAGRE